VVITEHYENLVASIAYEFSRKFHMVPVEDIRQELWVWFLEHPNKVKVWEALDGKQSTKLIARSLRNAAKDYCQKEKANAVGYRVDDLYYYDREVVELLLPAVMRGDLVAPSLVDLGFSSTKKVAAEGGNWFAMMADIQHALEKLPEEQYNLIYLRFADNSDIAVVAKELSISQDAARMRVNRAMNNLINFLGGKRPRRERDYTEEQVNEQRVGDTESTEDVRDDLDETEGSDLD
jgi:RNA polymerase sigma factor (sigma-70 family)